MSQINVKRLIATACAVLCTAACAAPSEVNLNLVSGPQVRFFKNIKLEASTEVSPLVTVQALNSEQAAIASTAQSILTNNPALSIMIVDRGNIIFEGYNSPASKSTPLFSFSMSKSLTAYTIGAMHCAGKIGDLSKPGSAYSSDLSNTVYGEASVQNLLTMSSGVRESSTAGQQRPGEFFDFRNQKISGVDYLKQYSHRDIKSGTQFRYSNTDTISLSTIADSRGGFVGNFQQYIWNNIGAESPGYWMTDNTNAAISATGFSATARDWVRLAQYSIRMLKSNDVCVRNFMSKATTTQIKNKTERVGAIFNGYGYQTWTNPKFGDGMSYWWVGYAGQRVGIDPNKERIIMVSSWKEDYMKDVYRLFDDFQRMK